MKRNRRNSIRKERIIMLTSSAFVLAALTMTGLYMKGQEIKEQDDGYTLDFTALENSADDKLNEITSNRQTEGNTDMALNTPEEQLPNMEDDLDYMPLEAGSGQVEIPGRTIGGSAINASEKLGQSGEKPGKPEKQQTMTDEQTQEDSQAGEQEVPEEDSAPQSVTARELHFSESDGLLRPVNGSVLIPYSMDSSVYFTTLDQYKRNPATVYEAAEGTAVTASAAGKVVNIFDDAEIGHAVTIDLGDGYQVTYGQLTDIQVQKDNYVEAGDKLGTVAAPTKYYSTEGSNLYFRMEKDGQPLNPEVMF